MFINLSNHTSDRWSEVQLKAAHQYGDIIDIPFPDVPANADERYIEELANEMLQKVIGAGDVDAVMVQGEFTLTHCIVKKLKQQGIKALSACSEREVVEETDGDGNTIRHSVFKFIRFREYAK